MGLPSMRPRYPAQTAASRRAGMALPPGLPAENNGEKDQVGPRLVVGNDLEQVFVDMQDKIGWFVE